MRAAGTIDIVCTSVKSHPLFEDYCDTNPFSYLEKYDTLPVLSIADIYQDQCAVKTMLLDLMVSLMCYTGNT